MRGFKSVTLLWKRSSIGDKIAFVALALSLQNFGAQVLSRWEGPRTEILELQGRVVEFRCMGPNESCWSPADARTRRVSLIVPVFVANTGAIGENEMIDRFLVTLRSDRQETIVLDPIAYWYQTSGSNGSREEPFHPLLVPGRAIEGGEVRFTGFREQSRLSWLEFAQSIIDGSRQEVWIELQALAIVESDVETASCRVNFTDRQREILRARRDEMRTPVMSVVCSA